MNRALFIGRFQPYHLGHHEAVKKILKENDELIIAVGSAQDSLLPSSPFTCGERIEMIHLALKEEKCHDKCFLIGVPDVNEHPIWAARVIEYIPKFETLYTNNPLTKFLFEVQGIKVKEIKVGFSDYSSTKIRKLLSEEKNWKNFLHPSTAGFLKKINAVKRLKAISEKEKK
ncbi:MAG TPA: nicotinamide-nucleotide adenylyltransferase [archaeon]|nr:nicotinamide-nucleotide adenylyltransferase [archaeon]